MPLTGSGRTLAGCCLVLLSSAVAVAKDGLAPRALSSCGEFSSPDEIGATLADLCETYPELASCFDIGESVDGRAIHAIRVSVDPDVESVEPEVRIVGAIHGNECMAAEVVLTTAAWLASDYGVDPFVTRLLEGAEIVLVPLLNPDGYSGPRATRENSNGVDLNRNFHFAWTGGGGAPFSEPETRALRSLSLESSFNLGISYHTVAKYVNAPWNYTPHHPPDAELLQSMGEGYAQDSGYEVVFGWDWYDIQGDINDWSLGTRGTFDWTMELMSDRDPQWGINREGLEGFLSFLFQGISGTVTDEATGAPLPARIEVSPAGAPVFTDPDLGDYHRMLLPGLYDLTVYSPGYRAASVSAVSVEVDSVTRVDVALKPDDGLSRYAFAVTGMTMPARVHRDRFDRSTYLNDTLVWDALGPPDGIPYSLSADPGGGGRGDDAPLPMVIGSITLDMGVDAPVTDVEGPDLRVVSATESDDRAAVLVATERDGPFIEVGRGSGTLDVDIRESGFSEIRFVRVVDLNTGTFEAARSGYDLDAVVNITATGPDGPSETAVSGGLGCGAAGNASPSSRIGRLLLQLLGA